jgi:hypothetical protein
MRDGQGITFVMSVVADSISRSSPDRSVNPGRTCLACSRSKAVTVIQKCGRIELVSEYIRSSLLEKKEKGGNEGGGGGSCSTHSLFVHRRG